MPRIDIEKLVAEYSDPPTVTIKADDLGLLAYCAASYDRRLRAGNVPPLLWEKLPQEWRDKIGGLGKDHRYEERPR